MSTTYMAEFGDANAMLRGAHLIQGANHRLLDGYSPYPVEGLIEMLDAPGPRVRVTMFVGGFGVAALAYLLEWWSAVVNYPINSGGRPLHSWPAFMMFPFSVGILSAAVCGLIALLCEAGLPRLHHPKFAVPGFESASQDRFFLEWAAPDTDEARQRLIEQLHDAGAIVVREVPG